MQPFHDLKSAPKAQRASVLALNNKHAAELSWLEAVDLDHLIEQAFFAEAIGDTDAVLIGFDQSADYASVNFLWFKDRYPRFAYIDRIVVADSARGRGLARQLYGRMFAAAVAADHTIIACEVNSQPPNPGSDAFHVALGFAVVGEASIYGGSRSVRYYTRGLAAEDAGQAR